MNMTRYREQNNEITPAVPTLFLYDTGEQSFTSAGEFHIWDTIKIKTSGFHYVADENKITLLTNTSGLFMLEYDCSFYTVANDTDVIVTTDLYKNGALQDGGTIKSTVSGTGTPVTRTCQTMHYIIYLKKDDYIQIKTTTSANTAIQSGDTSRLLITFLPMNGYDNGKAGRIQFKGEIMR
jgi:hypothetical protein